MDPLNPQAPRAETTPLPGQPLQSQGIPTGQDPASAPGQEFATPEERQQLMDLLEATHGKMAELKTAEFSGANAKDAARMDAMKELFQMMQTAGVDLTSVESVNAFLDKMKAVNPNMAADFEMAIEALMGDEDIQDQGEVGMPPGMGGMPEMSPTETPQPPMGEMQPPTQNEALPQNLRGPIPPPQGAV